MRVTGEDAYATNLLASSRYDHLSPEDRGLLQELTLGALRWQGQLDFLIEHYSNRKLVKLDPEVVIALRLGIYQLRFLSRVPAHAAINESVNLVKANGRQSAAPFTNAVLRNVQRDSSAISIKDPIQALSVDTSHPSWLLRRWVDRFGAEETRDIALANNRAPRISFRFNSHLAPEAQTRSWFEERSIIIRDSQLAPSAAWIESGSLNPQSTPVRDGWIYLQDEASQLVAHLMAGGVLGRESEVWSPSREESEMLTNSQGVIHSGSGLQAPHARFSVLDVCAAPGSKTSLLAGLAPPGALIVAGDLHFRRLQTMKELGARISASHLNPIGLIQYDATRDLPLAEQFDLVLLDAPCSGLGTLQRHPEIKWRLKPAKLKELAELQKRLLTNAAAKLRAGGLLGYAVCSTEPEEAEDVIAWFRQSRSEYRDVTRERLAELGLDPAQFLNSSFGARTFPHRHKSEGFFVCVLWKRK